VEDQAVPSLVSDRILDRLFAFTKPFEGAFDHMYLDSAGNGGNVTVGIGFMLPTVAAARALPFEPNGEIENDFKAVKAAKPGYVARYYRSLTKCRLPPEGMRAEFDRRVRAFAVTLHTGAYHLDIYPDAATVAILDMAYNLGASALVLKWPNFKTACFQRDWPRSARECTRRGIQPARNQATAALFMEAAMGSHSQF
jgi:GH24 family phage-related lysozyme (muramidase)